MSSGRILITGGSGFIGCNLVEFYRSKGYDVINLDGGAPRNAQLNSLWKECSILDREKVSKLIHDFRPDNVIHMAARTDLHGTTLEDYEANRAGVQNVVDAVNSVGTVHRALYASSRMIVQTGYIMKSEWDYKPNLPYGESKVETEKVVRAQPEGSVPWLLFRPTSIWGEWFDIPYKTFFMTVAKNRYVHPKGMRVMKSYGYVGNAVYEIDRFLHATDEQFNGRAYWVGDYPALEVLQWGQAIQRAMGRKPIPEVPYTLMKAVALAGDFAKVLGMKEPPLTSFRLNNLTIQMEYDFSREEKIWGKLPYSLEEGVERTVKWLRDQGQI
jgi:nucleoside-diphosphate-sugar epimerase